MRSLFLFLAVPLYVSAQKITLPPKSFPIVNAPVQIDLKRPGLGFYGLYDRSNGSTYPLQWENNTRAWFILEDSLPAHKTRTLELKNIKPPKNAVTLEGYESGIMVKNNGKPVFFYNTIPAMPPADSPAYYQRSGFIHPLYSPTGKAMTDDFPVTHAHQHAMFHSWADTRFRNNHIDFWNQFRQEGDVRHLLVMKRKEGPVFSEMTTVQEYFSTKHGVVLKESWTIRIYATPADHYLFDLFLEQENISKDSLFLNKYIYGGMAFRGARQWDPDNKTAFQNRWHVLTSENLQDSAANHTSARWVNVNGLIDKAPVSVTVFDHKSNFRYPQKIRVHPSMPYWAYSPVVDGPFVIAPGGKYNARYRYYLTNELPAINVLGRIEMDWLNL